ncbi:MAG: metal ABC transporter permease [Candidatus Omnitrophica bacterium]|nr:metal ABC transporter permease [Candidatus Omnitrophota bacterium]
MKPRSLIPSLLAIIFLAAPAKAARIGEVIDTNFWEQTVRFLSFQDRAVVMALIGSLMIGLNCGLLGSYMVVRRLSMIGDTIGHAVLPGVCLGYLFAGTRAPLPIFIGAIISGVAASFLLSAIVSTTRIPKDAAMGIVLSSFFGFGIVLLTYIQRQPGGNKSGLDKFLFGQSAAFSMQDLILMGTVTFFVIATLWFLHKEMLCFSFDSAYASTIGVPTRLIHFLQMTCLSFAIVVGIQAVGVVLVSAMLITPAATAYLVRERLPQMLRISAILGMMAGAFGTYCSFLSTGLPTGPFIVVFATLIFIPTYLFAPRHGVLRKWWRNRSSRLRTARENTLKSIFHIFEKEGFVTEQVGVLELAHQRRQSEEEVQASIKELERSGFATQSGDQLVLTPEGYRRACEIVRNHRLWELYLVKNADIAADHVHDDAERIEHVLSHEIIHELEKELEFPDTDPHGKPIPGWEDLKRGTAVDVNPKPEGPGLINLYKEPFQEDDR